MSETEAKAVFLRRERSYLKTWARSLSAMIADTSKGDARYWDLVRESEAVSREIGRASRRLRMID